MAKESLRHSNHFYAPLNKLLKEFNSKEEKVEYSSLPPLEKCVRILTDEPEINPIHKFGLYSDTIVNMILSSDPKFSIGINGDWGTGKTTLMKIVQMKLAKKDKTLRYSDRDLVYLI